MDEYEEEYGDADVDFPPSIETIAMYNSCDNCMRTQSQFLIDEHEYKLNLEVFSTLDIYNRRKFRNPSVPTTNDPDNALNIMLCDECAQHLILIEHSQTANRMEYAWPAFVWFLLTNSEIKREYNAAIWRFIPLLWRHWWITDAQDIYPDITIDDPSPIFIDRTNDIRDWNESIESYELPRLAKACNTYLMPTILCPWGCTEYIHK
jgi:hypothetical protein